MARVFTNGPGDRVQSNNLILPKIQKMVVDVSLFNFRHYNGRIKGKWSYPGKRVAPLTYTLVL